METTKNSEANNTAKKISIHEMLLLAIVAEGNKGDGIITAKEATALVALLTRKVAELQAGKATTKGYVYSKLLEAGAKGISKAAITMQFITGGLTGKAEEGVNFGTEEGINKLTAFTTNLNWFVQPSFYKKEGWPVAASEAGLFYLLTQENKKAIMSTGTMYIETTRDGNSIVKITPAVEPAK